MVEIQRALPPLDTATSAAAADHENPLPLQYSPNHELAFMAVVSSAAVVATTYSANILPATE